MLPALIAASARCLHPRPVQTSAEGANFGRIVATSWLRRARAHLPALSAAVRDALLDPQHGQLDRYLARADVIMNVHFHVELCGAGIEDAHPYNHFAHPGHMTDPLVDEPASGQAGFYLRSVVRQGTVFGPIH